MLQSRKYALNAPQPGERVTITTTTATKTAVERRAIATARASFETWAVAPPRIRELRLSLRALLQDGRAGCLGEPDALQRLDRAVGPEPVERLVDAAGQLAALLEHEPEALLAARSGAELTHDFAVGDLHGSHVERGRKVDHEAVDLPVLERLHSRVVRVVDLRRAVRLDLLDDVVVARRPDLCAEPVLPEPVDRAHRGNRLFPSGRRQPGYEGV